MNRKGEKLRSVSVKGMENLVCEVTQDRGKKPMMLIGVTNDHDLVLEFSNVNERKKLQLEVDSDVIMVMRTSLSMKEFASALGMKASDVFVKKMFAIVDKDNDNRISFQEFLDMIVLFSKGRTDDKLQIIFDMCDSDKNGTVDKEELSELLNSLIDIAKTKRLSDEEVGELINSMFKSTGFDDKHSLTYD